jgi:hypothetical protein
VSVVTLDEHGRWVGWKGLSQPCLCDTLGVDTFGKWATHAMHKCHGCACVVCIRTGLCRILKVKATLRGALLWNRCRLAQLSSAPFRCSGTAQYSSHSLQRHSSVQLPFAAAAQLSTAHSSARSKTNGRHSAGGHLGGTRLASSAQ